MEQQRRLPALERSVAELKPEDIRVVLIGTILDQKGNMLVLDDGSGRVNVTFEQAPPVKVGQLVRLAGRVVPSESGLELAGEFVQDFSKLDVGLWKRVKDLERDLNNKV